MAVGMKKGGWADRLKRELTKLSIENIKKRKFKIFLVYNRSISGETTTRLLNRLRFELEIIKPDVVIFAVGINDTYRTDKETFQKNVEEIIKITKEFTDKIVWVGLTRVDEGRTNPVFWNKKAFYKNSIIEEYDRILKEICRKEDIIYIDVSDIKTTVDGLHLDNKGHKEIFERISAHIQIYLAKIYMK